MNTLKTYINEALFTDVDTQINDMDVMILKKQLSKNFKVSENYIDIKDKLININKELISIDFANKNIETFIDNIYKQGYRFGFIYILNLEINEKEQIKYFENITVQNIFITFLKRISLEQDWNINFKGGYENVFFVENFINIRFFNYKFKLKNMKNGVIKLNQPGPNDIDIFDNVLQHINTDNKIKTLSIGIFNMENIEIDIAKKLTNIINDCKFIENKNLIPSDRIYFYYKIRNMGSYYTFNITNIPGKNSLELKFAD